MDNHGAYGAAQQDAVGQQYYGQQGGCQLPLVTMKVNYLGKICTHAEVSACSKDMDRLTSRVQATKLACQLMAALCKLPQLL